MYLLQMPSLKTSLKRTAVSLCRGMLSKMNQVWPLKGKSSMLSRLCTIVMFQDRIGIGKRMHQDFHEIKYNRLCYIWNICKSLISHNSQSSSLGAELTRHCTEVAIVGRFQWEYSVWIDVQSGKKPLAVVGSNVHHSIVRDNLDGTTSLHATCLWQAYDTNRFM